MSQRGDCGTIIYQNVGGIALFVFGDQDGVPFCDDVGLVGAERLICGMQFTLGGGNSSGGVVPVTLVVKNGNVAPACPDSPDSQVLFTTSFNLALTSPHPVELNFDPPILVNEDFIWVCLSTPPPANDAAWVISEQAEIGTTADIFIISNGDGVCTFGCGGDYFFFGGNPFAGFDCQITAIAAPPGACCRRDIDIGGGMAQCDDAVNRFDCLGNPVNVWKPGLCADFGMTDTPCSPCITDEQLCLGATLEGEPTCGPGYVDMYNQGCLEEPFAFSPIACGAVVCGEGGNYNAHCTQDSECALGQTCDTGTNACTGPTDSRDSDWYLFTLTQATEITAALTARFPAELVLMRKGGLLPGTECPTMAAPFAQGEACATTTITSCLPPGEWILQVRPSKFTGIPCGTKYRLTLTCGTCRPPSNDRCADAIPTVFGCSGHNFSATNDFAPFCDVPSPNQGVWYRVIGTGNTMTATTCYPGTDFDTMIQVWCSCDLARCIGGNDDAFGPFDPACEIAVEPGVNRGSRFSWCSLAGQEYLIHVGGFGTSVGNFGLLVTDDGTPCSNAIPCNDECANAAVISSSGPTGVNTCFGSTSAEPLPTCQPNINRDAWWLYFPPCTGVLTIDTEGSTFAPSNDTVLAVYDRCGLNELACDDNSGTGSLSSVTLAVTQGQQLVIRVGGYGPDACGDVSLNFDCRNCICPGDLTGDGLRAGDDIQTFIDCYLTYYGGWPSAPCVCADMDANLLLTDPDLPAFVDVLLMGPAACPPGP